MDIDDIIGDIEPRRHVCCPVCGSGVSYTRVYLKRFTDRYSPDGVLEAEIEHPLEGTDEEHFECTEDPNHDLSPCMGDLRDMVDGFVDEDG